MSKIDWLIVGLGNPDSKYRHTRHNIGWIVLDEFCKKHKIELKSNPGVCEFADIVFRRKNIVLAKPTTYMNDSGRAIAWLKKKYLVEDNQIIIVVDEYNFPVGRIQLKSGGSDGGHNGISSVMSVISTNKFFRLRCGIDNKFGAGELVDYVLSNFYDEDQVAKAEMIEKAIDAITASIEFGAGRAMTLVNSGRLWKKHETEKEEKAGEAAGSNISFPKDS